MENAPNIFLSPRLVGRRFEQHGLPLDILKDFSVLDEMVKSVAKMLYRQEHSDRRRMPKKFFDDISLQIVGIEEGSTVVDIALVCMAATSTFLPTPAEEYAGKARDCIIETIDAAAKGNLSSSETLTHAQLMMFDRFGCSLQEGESILFPKKGSDSHVAFTRDARRTLISKASQNGYQETVSIYGSISEMDQDRKSFLLNTIAGQRIPIKKYEEDQTDDVIVAMTEYAQGRKVLLHGTGKYSASGQLESVESIEDITLLDQIDFGYQLAEIGELQPGWLDGKGASFDKNQLRQLGILFHENYSLEKDPWVYPAQDGLLLAEWEKGDWRFSMEIELASMKGDFLALNMTDNQEFSKVFDLMSPVEWKTLCSVLEHPEKGVQA